ncbi:MAG: hypothetical protein JWR01_843 [Subtercola sp.]|nr:hypothetical protein [Subtercola sp.]
MLVASLALGTAFALTAPAAANAQAIVSQGTGRLVSTSLLSSTVLDTLVPLKGAQAVNATGGPDVIVDTPVDALASVGLSSLRVGLTTVPVFGGGGVIRLGAAGQYGRANHDGSSVAFSGTVSSAPGLIGVTAGAVSPSQPIGTPTAGNGATVAIGTPAVDPVTLQADFVELAASAAQTVEGAQSGQYRLGSFGVVVGGMLVATPVSTIRPAIETLRTALTTAGVVPPDNPFAADFTVKLTAADLQAAGLGSDVNALPADTDLTLFIPQAVSNRITGEVNDFLATASAALPGVPVGMRPALQLAVTAAHGIVDPITATLGSPFRGPVGIALRSLAQLVVNHREIVNGSFTQTALRVGVGAGGQGASVDLASAAVGPNTPPTTPPTTQPTPGATGATTGPTGGTGAAGTGGNGGATLAHTGAPLETQLLPWSALALALLGAGFAAFGVTAKRRGRNAAARG